MLICRGVGLFVETCLRHLYLTALLAVLVCTSATAEPRARLVVTALGGGAFFNAFTKAFLQPFAQTADVTYRMDDWGGELAKIEAAVDTKQYPSMLYESSGLSAQQACDAGLVEPIDYETLGGTNAYIKGSVNECAFAFMSWSYVYGYRTDAFGGRHPRTINDFFDTKNFPGPRALPRSSYAIVEMALLADGVPPEQIYPTLSTDEGLERAIAKLQTIRSSVTVFWTAFSQAPQLLSDGEVVMSIGANGRIDLAREAGKPVDIVWDGQMLDYGFISIPAGLPDKALALRFLEFMSDPKIMAGLSRYMTYGPSRLDAFAYIDPETAKRLPTAPQNMTRYVVADPKFWSMNVDRVERRYLAWMSQSQ